VSKPRSIAASCPYPGPGLVLAAAPRMEVMVTAARDGRRAPPIIGTGVGQPRPETLKRTCFCFPRWPLGPALSLSAPARAGPGVAAREGSAVVVDIGNGRGSAMDEAEAEAVVAVAEMADPCGERPPQPPKKKGPRAAATGTGVDCESIIDMGLVVVGAGIGGGGERPAAVVGSVFGSWRLVVLSCGALCCAAL